MEQEAVSKQEDSVVVPPPPSATATVFEEKALPEVEGRVEEDMEEEEDDDDDEEEDVVPSSFCRGWAAESKGNGSRKSPFSTLSFASSSFMSTIPSRIHQSFLSWKKKTTIPQKVHLSPSDASTSLFESSTTVSFHTAPTRNLRIRATIPLGQELRAHHNPRRNTYLRTCSMKTHQEPRSWNLDWLHDLPQTDTDCILSLHIPADLHHLNPIYGTA